MKKSELKPQYCDKCDRIVIPVKIGLKCQCRTCGKGFSRMIFERRSNCQIKRELSE